MTSYLLKEETSRTFFFSIIASRGPSVKVMLHETVRDDDF